MPGPDEPAVTVDDIEPTPAQAAAPAKSVVDTIRSRHAARKRTLDLAIPEWDGDVVVRYGPMPKRAIVENSRRRGAAAQGNAALLAAACQEVFIRDDRGQLRPAREADGNPAPIRFDGRLADLFGLSADSVEGIVLAMYADDLAVGAHAKRIWDWQTGQEDSGLLDADAEEVDDLAGEGGAAT